MYVKGERCSNCERGNILETFLHLLHASVTIHVGSPGLLSLSSAYVSLMLQYSTFEYLMRKNRCWI